MGLPESCSWGLWYLFKDSCGIFHGWVTTVCDKQQMRSLRNAQVLRMMWKCMHETYFTLLQLKVSFKRKQLWGGFLKDCLNFADDIYFLVGWKVCFNKHWEIRMFQMKYLGKGPVVHKVSSCHLKYDPFSRERMLGTLHQYLPMILSNNYWCQNKPTSLLDILIGTIH